MYALIFRAFVALTIILCPVLASAQGLRVVARVNDDAITDFELNQRVVLAIRTTNQADTPELRQRIAPQMLRQMIDERLQIQDAKRLGLRATDGEIAQRIGEIERSANLAPGQFKQYLQGIGVPYEVAAQQLEATISWLRSCAAGSVPKSTSPTPKSTKHSPACAPTSARPNPGSARYSFRSTGPTRRKKPAAAPIASSNSSGAARRSRRSPSNSRTARRRRAAATSVGSCPAR